MNNYNITLFEACEILNRSKKSISRYVRQGELHPKKIKSKQGTLEYRFSKADLEDYKMRQDMPDETSEDRRDRITPDEAGQDGIQETKKLGEATASKMVENGGNISQQNEGIIPLLQDTVSLLKDQLGTKDNQIESLNNKIDQLIERDRETNILIKGMQDQLLLLGAGQTGQNTPDRTRHDTTKDKKEINIEETTVKKMAENGGSVKQKTPNILRNSRTKKVKKGKEIKAKKVGNGGKKTRQDNPIKTGQPNPDRIDEIGRDKKAKDKPKKRGLFGRLFGRKQ